MSINWLVTVPTPQGIEIPTYGNYGGPNYSDGRIFGSGETPSFLTPPVDALDALFQQHDRAYSASSDPLLLAQADLQLAQGIAALPDWQSTPEAHLYGGATELVMVEQIRSRHQHPEIFAPGEEALLIKDGRNSLEQGRPDPDVLEVFAAFEQVSNLLAFAAFDGQVSGPTTSVAANADVLVDDSFYFSVYHDVAAAGVDPDQHFANAGWREERNPNAFFDTQGYLAPYTDVAAAGINPLEHYTQHGWKEGRDPSPQFDTASYLSSYPDVAQAGVDPLEHFLASGLAEGRSAFPDGVFG